MHVIGHLGFGASSCCPCSFTCFPSTSIFSSLKIQVREMLKCLLCSKPISRALIFLTRLSKLHSARKSPSKMPDMEVVYSILTSNCFQREVNNNKSHVTII